MVLSETISYGLLALLVLAVIASIIFSNKIKRAYADWHLSRSVRKLGHAVMQNIILPDGMDGTVYIDSLILLPDEILVASVARYQGAVFASENIDIWTQVVGKRSYKFNNPLLKLEQEIAAVRAHIPDVKITGVLIFPDGVNFPKGKPDNVISVDEAKTRYGARDDQQVKTAYTEAWNKIKNRILSED